MDTISSLKLADLKRELRARNLPITGTKQILVDRLLEAMSAEKSNDNDSIHDDLLDEDSMLGDEDSDAEDGTSDTVAADLTISSPTATVPPTTLSSPSKIPEAVKRTASSPMKAEQNGNSTSQDGAPPSKKKIILNRQPVPEAAPQVLNESATAEAIKAAAESKTPAPASTGERPVIKLSEVTTAPVPDKLKARQEKFGAGAAPAPATAEGKSAAAVADVPERLKKRAERFGVTGGASASPATGKVSLTSEDEAKLAKRRERFGLEAPEKVDEQKQKRAARFGINNSKPSAAAAVVENPVEVEEKKKQRAARFAAAL